MNTQKTLIALPLYIIISIAIGMLIVGCPIDSDSSDSSDTTAPTIVSSIAGTEKVVITFSEAIKFGSVGGTGFTVEAGTVGSLDATMDVTAAISGSMLTLTLNTPLTNAQTHVKVAFADNAVTDTAGNILATNATTELTVDVTLPTVQTIPLALSTIVFVPFTEEVIYGNAIGPITPSTDNILTIFYPLNITVKTGTSTSALNTTKKILAAGIDQKSIDSKKTLMLAFDPDSPLTVGDYIQITFGANTITDLVGNALASDTKTAIFQVQAAP